MWDDLSYGVGYVNGIYWGHHKLIAERFVKSVQVHRYALAD